MTFLFVTSSQDKLSEVKRILHAPVESLDVELAEPQAVNLGEVIKAKAEEAYGLVHAAVMVEDSGLFLDAWNGLPGALIKWFVQRVGVEGICAMMHEFPNRSASARTLIGYHDGALKLFEGVVRGHITHSPRGSNGFGFDSIFVPEGSDKTYAEMEAKEKDRYSMRQRALLKLAADADIARVH
jgi:non-canonical purine NTP pyrophosphatase (RdgB/HAM1 family)